MIALVCVMTVAVLGFQFAGRETPGRVDRALGDAVSAAPTGPVALAMRAVIALGDPAPVAVALLVLVVLAWRGHGRRGAVLAALAPTSAMVCTSLLLKPLIDRTKTGELALPSGHTTAVISLALTALVLLAGTAGWTRRRVTSAALLITTAIAEPIALVAQDVHYATDTIAGAAVAAAAVLLIALLIDHLADHHRRA